MDKTIQLRDLTKVYRMESQVVEALSGVSFEVSSGAMVSLTGPSGSGKSTLLHIIGTLDRASSGSVRLLGTDVTGFNDLELSQFRNRSIGFVFQMNNLLPEFTALENVMMPGLIGEGLKEKVKERAASLLALVGLSKREKHRPGELSGGEQQRVAIARALFMDPPILLADEPTGNLDKKSSRAVQELLMELCETRGTTMIMVTHDMNLAAQLPQRALLEDGRILEFGGSL